jgi:hypothetical protein
VKGILSVSDADQRTLCFLREIEDISEHLTDRKASKFIDTTYSPDGQLVIDSEAETLLHRLKHTRIPNALQSENIFSYKVRWESNGINRTDHADYIAQFNKDFHDTIQKQIDHCAQSNAMVVSDPLQREVLEHAIQCKTYIAKFHGRTDVMDKVNCLFLPLDIDLVAIFCTLAGKIHYKHERKSTVYCTWCFRVWEN